MTPRAEPEKPPPQKEPLCAVYDIETVRWSQEVGAKSPSGATPEQFDAMGIACIAIATGYLSDPAHWQYHFFLTVDPQSLVIEQDSEGNDVVVSWRYDGTALHDAHEMLHDADLVVSFNGIDFDDNLIRHSRALQIYRHYSGADPAAWRAHLDLCKEVIAARKPIKVDRDPIAQHGRLQDLAIYTLGETKRGDGLSAVAMLREGRVKDLKLYNIQDVRLTKDLACFAYRNGFLIDDYGLVPLSLDGGVEAWEYPGEWWRKKGKEPGKSRPATTEQIRKLTEGKEGVHGPLAGSHWRAARCLKMYEASALIDALFDWNRLKQDAQRRAA